MNNVALDGHMNKYTVSIIDVLVGLAILMILAALFVPQFIPSKPSVAAPRQSIPVKRLAR